MGLFDFEYLSGTRNKIKSGGAGSSEVQLYTSSIYETGENVPVDATGSILENWYKQKPYAFKFKGKTFYLPISPSNLTITTHFATNVISTMYATVEEHSEQRYFDISISGTTGMSPRYYVDIEAQMADSIDTKAIGRAGVPIKSSIAGNIGGFFKRTQSIIQSAIDQSSDMLEADKPKAAVNLHRSGYAAFHNFYKFLLLHKKHIMAQDGAENIGENESQNLMFINYKDNNQYNVVINTFNLSRDSSNPMLYNYQISMRGYNLTSVRSGDEVSKDIAKRSAELGLDGLETTSYFAKMSNATRKAKNAAYAAIAAAKGFGA